MNMHSYAVECFACWVIFVFQLSSANFFQKFIFSRVSKGLDPDLDLHSVGPDLDPTCLQSRH